MLAVIANTYPRQRDELDIEFDAVMKADQLKRGVRYNGLFLVEKGPVVAAPATEVATSAPVTKRSFRKIFADIIFGDTVA